MERERKKIQGFTDLEAWKVAHKLALYVYEITKQFPKNEQFGITNQMRRAAVSVSSNIAEGFSRNTPKDKSQFYAIAKGSATELENQLILCRDIGYIKETEYAQAHKLIDQAGRLITGLLKFTRNLSLILLAFLIPYIPYTIPYILPAPTAQAATIIPKPDNSIGLVGHWTFDGRDMTTNVADVSGNGNHGTLSGFTSTTTAIGKLGQALRFSGGEMNLPNMTSSFDTEATLVMWVKLDSNTPGAAGFAYLGTSGVNNHYPFSDANLYIDVFRNDRLNLGSNSSFDKSEWHMVTITNKPGTDGYQFWQNTSIFYSGTGEDTISLPTAPKIGESEHPSFIVSGLIDDVRVYNRALSEDEIAALYQSGSVKFGSSHTLSAGTSLDEGLVAHYTFDGKDMVSNVADVSGAGNHGSLVGQTSTTTTRGKLGQALDFDGSNDYVTTGTLETVGENMNATGLAASLWFRTSQTSRHVLLGSNAGGKWTVFDMNLRGANTARMVLSDGFDAYASAGFTLSDGGWHHLAQSIDVASQEVTFYIDGVAKTTTYTLQGAVSDVELTPLFIGALNNSSAILHANADIDDVRIYNRELTASEAAALYKLGSAVHEDSNTLTRGSTLDDGLALHWTFDGKDITSNIADASVTGADGHIVGQTSTTTVPGKLGQAIALDGVNDYVRTTIAATTLGLPQMDDTYFTASAWVKRNDLVNEHTIFQIMGNVNRGWALRITAAHAVIFSGDLGGTYGSTASNVITDTAWHHITLVRDNTTYHVYVDGVEQALALTPTAYPQAGSCYFTVGIKLNYNDCNLNNIAKYANIDVDDVRLYSRALSASEALQLYLIGK